jgi:hypothetical protein
VEILTPLPYEQRQRAISAAMALLVCLPLQWLHQAMHPRLLPHLREQLDQVFSIEKEAVGVIASDLPGKGERTKMLSLLIVNAQKISMPNLFRCCTRIFIMLNFISMLALIQNRPCQKPKMQSK